MAFTFVFVLYLLHFIFASASYAEHSKTCKLHSPYKELVGSSESLARQNEVADHAGLLRVKNYVELKELVKKKYFVSVARSSSTYYYTGRTEYRFVLPFAFEFLKELAAEFYKETVKRPEEDSRRVKSGGRLKISSLLRTENYQRWLAGIGISDANGEDDNHRSVHTTGAAFDISKKPMTKSQTEWLRNRLIEFERKGFIEATEEMCSNTFHVMVFPPHKSGQ